MAVLDLRLDELGAAGANLQSQATAAGGDEAGSETVLAAAANLTDARAGRNITDFRSHGFLVTAVADGIGHAAARKGSINLDKVHGLGRSIGIKAAPARVASSLLAAAVTLAPARASSTLAAAVPLSPAGAGSSLATTARLTQAATSSTRRGGENGLPCRRVTTSGGHDRGPALSGGPGKSSADQKDEGDEGLHFVNVGMRLFWRHQQALLQTDAG